MCYNKLKKQQNFPLLAGGGVNDTNFTLYAVFFWMSCLKEVEIFYKGGVWPILLLSFHPIPTSISISLIPRAQRRKNLDVACNIFQVHVSSSCPYQLDS